MVFNSPLVVGVAKISANACQYIACNPERLSADQVLHLLFCFPFQQLRRLAFCLWTFFCFPPPTNPFFISSSSSSSSSDSDVFYLDEEDLHSDWINANLLYSCLLFHLPITFPPFQFQVLSGGVHNWPAFWSLGQSVRSDQRKKKKKIDYWYDNCCLSLVPVIGIPWWLSCSYLFAFGCG